jgi:hypothetical protein
MINFNHLELNKESYRTKYLSAKPFPHLSIQNFCNNDKISFLYDQIPDLNSKSRDYMFAKNKFEKSNYGELGDLFMELQDDLRSDRLNNFLSFISCQNVFVDPKNHGGGLHQGRGNSQLDMHLDYNYHPLNKNWWREMNLLLYLNKNWSPQFGGQLKLHDLRTDCKVECDVHFNTMVIQKCDDYTLHGYDLTTFPPGNHRTSIATYAFVKHVNIIDKPRLTDWIPNADNQSLTKSFFTRLSKVVIPIKNKILGSGTANNQ